MAICLHGSIIVRILNVIVVVVVLAVEVVVAVVMVVEANNCISTNTTDFLLIQLLLLLALCHHYRYRWKLVNQSADSEINVMIKCHRQHYHSQHCCHLNYQNVILNQRWHDCVRNTRAWGGSEWTDKHSETLFYAVPECSEFLMHDTKMHVSDCCIAPGGLGCLHCMPEYGYNVIHYA